MIEKPRVLVTGGGTFLGNSIAAALLAEGAEVTLLVRPGAEDKLGSLAERARWYSANVWDSASLKGRARGHGVVIHTVGSLSADPAQGLTFQYLNFVSARNVANMCVNSGVPHMVLLSSVRAPWINGQYIAAKREAETYIPRVGLRSTVIRAPISYLRGMRRRPFYGLMTLLGSIPPLSWLWFGRVRAAAGRRGRAWGRADHAGSAHAERHLLRARSAQAQHQPRTPARFLRK